jgi:hypothetical protein
MGSPFKYSPAWKNNYQQQQYNCRGQIPVQPSKPELYKAEIHLDCYDEHGFDMYGYSALDREGNYVGDGRGVDRLGYTEQEHEQMGEWNGIPPDAIPINWYDSKTNSRIDPAQKASPII